MLKIPNKHFCILPFIHIHLTNWNDVKLCCYSDDVKKYTSDFNFVTDADYVKIRQDMIEGKAVAQCENCYKIERDGATSFRIRDTTEWIEKLKLSSLDNITPELIYYDIRNDHTCNLSCRMCNPGASTQVEKEFIKIGLTKPNNILRPKINEIVDLNLVKQLYVAGGEPSLMREFKTLLARAIEINRTDIFLRIITNATNVNKEFAELLSHFPNKEFVVSLDGYDQVNKYIRWPSDWNSIIGNIKRLYTITSKYNISFSVTVSMWNICSLSKLINFLNKEFSQPIIFLNEAVDGGIDNASPFNFPNKELALRDLESMKLLPNYQIDIFKNKLDYFISKINNTTIDTDKLKKFFDYNDLLDQSRNVKLIDYIPELDACRSYITKPI